MMSHKIALGIEERVKVDFLDTLLDMHYSVPEEVYQKARCQGYDLSKPYQVMVAVFDNTTEFFQARKGDERAVFLKKKRFIQAVANIVRERSPYSIVGIKNDVVVVLARCPDKKNSILIAPSSLAVCLKKGLNGILGNSTLSIGIGRVTRGIEDFKKSYQEARRVLAVIKKFGKKDGIYTYDSLGAYKVLFHVEDNEEVKNFALQILAPLMKYDQKKDTSLVKTLRTYLNQDCNNQKTSKTLYIHSNTLKYRLQRVQEIAGIDLNNSEHRLNVQLALKILDIQNLSYD